MKILLINNCFYRRGGSEAVFFGTADLLREAGHQVVFMSIEDAKNIECKDSAYFVRHGGRLSQMKDYFYNKNAARLIEKIIEKEKPDIAHAHLLWGGIGPSIIKVLHKYKTPLVHTVHDYRMVCPAYTFKNGNDKTCERCKRWNFYQCALHLCSKGSIVQSTLMAAEMYTRQLFFEPIKNISGFVFVSHFSEQKHIEHNPEFSNSRHIVLYNYTNPLLSVDIGKKKDYFLFFGRLSFEKGVSTLLRVFARHPELIIKVVGMGPLEEKLKTKYPSAESVNELEQSGKYYNNIQFIGYRSGKSLAELVRNARFVCVPSENYENNPMTIVESYSMGTPVIGANIGGIPEIIEEGSTGLLFESGNVDDLERAVLKAAKISPAEYQSMSESAFSFYQQHFSADSHYKVLMDFYREVLDNF